MSRRARLLLVAAVLLGLSGTAEERTFGTITDEQAMLRTGVAIAELGELGIARGERFSVPRPAGDAVSPYGMGLPLLEALPALAAAPWERRFGGGSSQTLFVFLQVLLVTAASVAAGLLSREAGATARGEALAVLGTAFGSPLWAYASAGYSEPLQAAALCWSLVAASVAARVREGVLSRGPRAPASRRAWRF